MKFHRILVVALALAAAASSCKKDDDEPAVFSANHRAGAFLQMSCDTIGSIQSQMGTQSTYIYFNNKSSRTLKIVWVNFSGGMTVYEDNLTPNSGMLQQTYLGHPWKITDAQDNCLLVLMAMEGGVTDTVTFVN